MEAVRTTCLSCSNSHSHACSHCAVPFWELVTNVQILSLDHTNLNSIWREEIPEQSISAFTSSALLLEWPVTRHQVFGVNSSIVTRTVIAAAQSGQLKHILCPLILQRPFAIRALLPGWVRLEHHKDERYLDWQGAARTLRPLLSHASLWLNSPTESIAREDRKLTGQEVQALRSYCLLHGIPKVGGEDRGPAPRQQSVVRYLPWLEEGAELSQQVAEVWNQVVQEGKADRIRCPCRRCQQHWL